jgi:hypothetical protein
MLCQNHGTSVQKCNSTPENKCEGIAHFVRSSSPRNQLIVWETTLRTKTLALVMGELPKLAVNRRYKQWESDGLLERRYEAETHTDVSHVGRSCLSGSLKFARFLQGLFPDYPRFSRQIAVHRWSVSIFGPGVTTRPTGRHSAKTRSACHPKRTNVLRMWKLLGSNTA